MKLAIMLLSYYHSRGLCGNFYVFIQVLAFLVYILSMTYPASSWVIQVVQVISTYYTPNTL